MKFEVYVRLETDDSEDQNHVRHLEDTCGLIRPFLLTATDYPDDPKAKDDVTVINRICNSIGDPLDMEAIRRALSVLDRVWSRIVTRLAEYRADGTEEGRRLAEAMIPPLEQNLERLKVDWWWLNEVASDLRFLRKAIHEEGVG